MGPQEWIALFWIVVVVFFVDQLCQAHSRFSERPRRPDNAQEEDIKPETTEIH